MHSEIGRLGAHAGRRILTMLIVVIPVLTLSEGQVVLDGYAAGSNQRSFSDSQIGQMQITVSSYPDVFGGLAGDPRTHEVTISVSPEASADRRSQALNQIANIESQTVGSSVASNGWTVRVVVRGPSQSRLNGVVQRATQQQPWRAIFWPHLTGFGIDPMNLDVVLGVDQITSTLTSAVKAFGGEIVLQVIPRMILYDGRTYDSEPYFGADRLVTSDGQQCSAGVEVFRGGIGHYGMITAGHCWGNNTEVYQGYWSNGMHASGPMGLVTESFAGNGYADAAFIDANDTGTSLAPTVWTSNNSTAHVTNWDSNFVGKSICTDGGFTYQNCTGVVDKANFCMVIAMVLYECHLEEAYSSNGTSLGQPGDSGGPIYDCCGGTSVKVIGFDTGGPCNGPCSTAWYTDYSAAANELGVILHT